MERAIWSWQAASGLVRQCAPGVPLVRREWDGPADALLLVVTVLFTEALVFTGASFVPSHPPLVSLMFPEHDPYRADPSLRGLSDVLAFLAQNPSSRPVTQLACS